MTDVPPSDGDHAQDGDDASDAGHAAPDAVTPPSEQVDSAAETRQLDLEDIGGSSGSRLPRTIGPFQIERLLGSGGMGAVYLGVDPDGNRVAVKVLPMSLAAEAGLVERFKREVDALGKVKSRHIVRLVGRGTEQVPGGGEFPFYAMELIEGRTLSELIHETGRVPWRDVVDIGVQTCKALKAAHNAGIIHRDLKPSNLMLAESDDPNVTWNVKLTDFGVAQTFATNRLTVTGGMVGTAEYMSPEQADGRRVTKQSDLYALGAVLYAALVGRPPFGGSNPIDVAQKHRAGIFDSPKRLVPEIPRWLDEVICQCLAKAPEDRPADAYVLQRRLAEIPAKVSLSQSEETQASTNSPNAPAVEGEVGGTLVAQMVRDEIAKQHEGTVVSRLLDNTTILVGLLAASVAAIYWLMPNAADREAERFAEAQELMQSDDPKDWREGSAILKSLVEQNPDDWTAAAAAFEPQLTLAKLSAPRTLRKQPTAIDEPTRLILKARRLADDRDYATAIQTLSDLRTVLIPDAAFDETRDWIDREIARLDGLRDDDGRGAFVRDRLTAADALAEDGQAETAASIRDALSRLYPETQLPEPAEPAEAADDD